MVKGTRILYGKDTERFDAVVRRLESVAKNAGYDKFIPSELAPLDLFIEKSGPEVVNQIYAFKDKGGRDICLIPEVTAVARRYYLDTLERSAPKPVRLFYTTRCYRYEQPQSGRYREFWQFGVESFGSNSKNPGDTKADMIDILNRCLQAVGLKSDEYKINESVKRGLDYYVEDGFEAEFPGLGAQKQIAGGGRYDVGIGFAIGIDRLILSLDQLTI